MKWARLNSGQQISINREVVVAQLVERLLTIQEVRGLTPVIAKFY